MSALEAAFLVVLQLWLPGASILWEKPAQLYKAPGHWESDPRGAFASGFGRSWSERKLWELWQLPGQSQGVQKGSGFVTCKDWGTGGQWLRWAGDSHRLQVLVSPRGVLWLPHVGRVMLCWDDKPPRAVSLSEPQLKDILVP